MLSYEHFVPLTDDELRRRIIKASAEAQLAVLADDVDALETAQNVFSVNLKELVFRRGKASVKLAV